MLGWRRWALGWLDLLNSRGDEFASYKRTRSRPEGSPCPTRSPADPLAPADVPCAREGDDCTAGLRVLDGVTGESFCRFHFNKARNSKDYGRRKRVGETRTMQVTISFFNPHVHHSELPPTQQVVLNHGCLQVSQCALCDTPPPPTRTQFDAFLQSWLCDVHFREKNEV